MSIMGKIGFLIRLVVCCFVVVVFGFWLSGLKASRIEPLVVGETRFFPTCRTNSFPAIR